MRPLLLVLLAWSVPALAETYTVDDAVRLALEHSYPVDAAQMGQVKAQAEATEAILGMGPALSIAGGYTRIDPVPQAAFQLDPDGVGLCDNITEADAEEAGMPLETLISFCKAQYISMLTTFGEPMEVGLRDNYFVTATLEQVLFAGGAMHQARLGARDMHRASVEQVRSAEHEIAYQAAQTFYGLVAAREAVSVTDEAVEVVQALATDVQDMAEVGVASRADLLAVQAQLSQARLDALRARHGLRIVERTFRVLLGLDDGGAIELHVTEPSEDLPLDAGRLRTMAIQRRPDLATLRHTIAAMDHYTSAAWASWLPAIVVQGNLN